MRQAFADSRIYAEFLWGKQIRSQKKVPQMRHALADSPDFFFLSL
jgi:hypothetical protein